MLHLTANGVPSPKETSTQKSPSRYDQRNATPECNNISPEHQHRVVVPIRKTPGRQVDKVFITITLDPLVTGAPIPAAADSAKSLGAEFEIIQTRSAAAKKQTRSVCHAKSRSGSGPTV